jgi:hypothetical protein
VISISLLVAAAISQALQGRDTAKYYTSLGAKFHKGIVLIHSADLRAVQHSYPWGIGIDLGFHFTNKKSWDACNCYPKLGASITFWDYDKPEILGYGATGLFYLEPVFGAQNRISFSFRAGFGLSYQSKPYDQYSNPDNLSYSTHFAFPILLGVGMNAWIGKQYLLSVNINYNHFSNGGIKEPNGGINWPTVSIGLDRYFKVPQFHSRTKTDWKESGPPAMRLDINFFLAIKQLEYQEYAPLPGIEAKGSRQVGRINALTLGLEWLYDAHANHIIKKEFEDIDCNKVSLAFGHEFLLGKFLFSQQLGVYVYKPFKRGADVYHRWGLRYRITDWLSFGVNLKAHRHVANFLDFRLGVSFNN